MREIHVPIEQIIQPRVAPIISGEFDLTAKAKSGYSGKRGIFMPEPGIGEIVTSSIKESVKIGPDVVKDPFTLDVSKVVNPDIKSRLDVLQRNLHERPISERGLFEIQGYYKELCSLGDVDPLVSSATSSARHSLILEAAIKGVPPDVFIKDALAEEPTPSESSVDDFMEKARNILHARPRVDGLDMRAQLPSAAAARIDVDAVTRPNLKLIAQQTRDTLADEHGDETFINRQIQRVESIADAAASAAAEAQEAGNIVKFRQKNEEANEARAFAQTMLEPIRLDAYKHRKLEEARSRTTIVRREGWNYEPNLAAFDQAELEGLFVPQVREIRDLWRQIEAAPNDEVRREQFQRHKETINEVRRELNRVIPPEGIPQQVRFFELQALLGQEFLNMTNRVEGNVFNGPEMYAEEIEEVRRIYHKLDTEGNETIREQLYTQLETLLTPIDFASGRLTQASELLNVLTEESLSAKRKGMDHYGMALEYAVERIIGRGDENVTSNYPQFGFYEGNNLEEMVQGARRIDSGFAMYLQNLKGKRSMSHELFKNMKNRRTFVGIVEEGLDPGSMRFIEQEVGGIPEVQRLFEEEYARMAAYNSFLGKGWILHDEFKDDVDPNVERMIYSRDYEIRKPVIVWNLDRERGEYVLTKLKKHDGTERSRKLRPWELKRAKNMGRSVSAVSLRRQYYGVVGDAPERISERVETVEGGEEIMMLASPLKLINDRYFVYQPGSAMFLTEWENRKKFEAQRDERRYAFKRDRKNTEPVHANHGEDRDVNAIGEKADPHARGGGVVHVDHNHGHQHGEPETVFGIFGTTERSNILMDSGTVDVKSSMWRADKLFFDQDDYALPIGHGEYESFGKYFFKKLLKKAKEDVHSDADFQALSHHEHGKAADRLRNFDIQQVLHGRSEWGEDRRKEYGLKKFGEFRDNYNGIGDQDNECAGQRLFLGITLMETKLDKMNKMRLWKKTAKLMPSRIAKIMPQYAVDEMKEVPAFRHLEGEAAMDQWNKIINKLTRVEYARVEEDTIGFRTDPKNNKRPLDQNFTPREFREFLREYQDTNRGTDKAFTEDELVVVDKWQRLGIEMSEQLAEIIWPMAPFLTDVPQTAWQRMGRDEMKRLLVNDHNDWGEAYKGITDLIANPATDHPEKALETVVDTMHHFVKNAKSPTSLEDAQQRVEAFVYAWGKMAEKKRSAKLLYDTPAIFRKPRSKMEEFNLQSGIAYDVKDMARYLVALASSEVISDDLKHAGHHSKTQFYRLTKELGADKWKQLWEWVRIFAPALFISLGGEAIGAFNPLETK